MRVQIIRSASWTEKILSEQRASRLHRERVHWGRSWRRLGLALCAPILEARRALTCRSPALQCAAMCDKLRIKSDLC